MSVSTRNNKSKVQSSGPVMRVKILTYTTVELYFGDIFLRMVVQVTRYCRNPGDYMRQSFFMPVSPIHEYYRASSQLPNGAHSILFGGVTTSPLVSIIFHCNALQISYITFNVGVGTPALSASLSGSPTKYSYSM